MKRLILSTKPPTVEFNEFVKYCDLLKVVYSKTHDIEYKFLTSPDSIEGRHSAWICIPYIRKFVDEYDEILWLNYDVIIIDQLRDIFDLLKTSKSLFSWKYKDPIVHTLQTGVSDASSSIVLFDCRNKERIKSFLNDWWNDAPPQVHATANPEIVWNKVWSNEKKQSIRISELNSHIEKIENGLFHVHEDLRLARLPTVKKYTFQLTGPRKNKKIAIVMRRQNFYSNGIGQNCIFLKHTFEAAGFGVDIVTNDDTGEISADLPYMFYKIDSINPSDYICFLFGSQVPPKKHIDAIRGKGIKCIMFNPVNVIDQFHQENFLYADKKSSTPLFEMTFQSFCDEIWVTDAHAESSLEYLQIINRNKVPVKSIPSLWSPLFLTTHGAVPMYKQREGGKIDLVILEPNLGYCKSGWLPLVICEKFYLDNPDKLNKVYLFNTPRSNKTAMGMINSLKIFEDKKIRLMDRMPINEILSFFSNPIKNDGNHVAFVSHSINSPLNYAYYDVLFSGFPFIHNSTYLKNDNIGYHYGTLFEGSAHIQSIIDDFRAGESLTKARGYLQRYDEYHCDNIKAYDSLVSKFVEIKVPLKSRISTYIICCNDERKSRMVRMFNNLNISLEYKIFDAFTSENSKEYLNFKHEKNPEGDGLICCSRSHIAVMKKFLEEFPAKEFILILEDDVRLLKTGFEQELENVINVWEKHFDEIDYINIGYLKAQAVGLKTDGILNWDMTGPKGALWGTQAYLVKRGIAEKIVKALDQPSAQHLINAIHEYIKVENKGKEFCLKEFRLSPDSFLPACWRQGFVKPMLVMEDQSERSLIHSWLINKDRNHSNDFPDLRDECDFYNFEPSLVITE
jgi:GR25 family glycosyltransferase involved in LPS biosynthesis